MTDPIAVASAVHDPDAAKIVQATMAAWAKPPEILPTRISENRTSRSVTRPRAMTSPASTKNGTAMSGKESRAFSVRITNTFN